jgi:predicted dinucleotide-binding enzyme
MTMRVGVLGSGAVAKVLARGFAKKGYDVRIGTRDASKVADVVAEGIAAGSFAEVAAHGEIVVLAVKGTAALDAAALAGARLDGKVVIDTSNPIADEPPEDGILRFFTGPNDSLLERLQAAHPAARFVKAWSCVGSGFMVDPQFPGGPPTMFICGNDPAAKAQVAGILREFGWDHEDLGKAAGARAIEPLCQLWCAPGFQRGQWAHAYKVLRLG